MKLTFSFGAMVVTILTLSNVVMAQAPQVIPLEISYQGLLTDSTGEPLADASYDVEFKFYDGAGVGASVLWSSGTVPITTSSGLFSLNLGSPPMPEIDPMFILLDYDVDTLFLGITVESNPEIVPRTEIASSPFALISGIGAWSKYSDSGNFAVYSDTASTLEGESAAELHDWNNLDNVPSDFADNIDDTTESLEWSSLTSVPPGFADGVDDEGGVEPGIASNTPFIAPIALVVDSMLDLSTVTITIPDSGYIYVTGRVFLDFNGTTSQNVGYVQIDETSGGFSDANSVVAGLYEYVSPIRNYFPVFVDRTYHKTSAGSYTFRLEGQGGSSDSLGVAEAYRPKVTAMYFPQKYGPVSK